MWGRRGRRLDRKAWGLAWAVLALGWTACGQGGESKSRPAGTPQGAGSELSASETPRSAAQTPKADISAAPFSTGGVTAESLVLITVDTLRWDVLGFSGHPEAQTPRLDRLAGEGRIFTQAHAHNVVTLPSHANILTGLYPYQHGVRENQGFTLGAEVPTLATMLEDAGFVTGAFVGAFPLDARFGLNRGFEVYDDRYPEGSKAESVDYPERGGDEVVGLGLDWWRRHDGSRRFLWVHLFDPHAPYAAPEPWASRFASDPYLGEVAAVDAYLTPLLDELAAAADSVLVAFTSDHGESLGEHGELTHGLFAYEATLKVPLVLWGGVVRPGLDGREARHVDIVPTMLGAAGLEIPSGLPGHSLLLGETPSTTYFESLSATLDRGWAPLRGVIAEGDKLIALPIPELYDLPSDPKEQRNGYAERRDRASLLAQELPEESRWPPARGAISAQEQAKLQSLGYLSGKAKAKTRYTAEDDPKRLVHLDRQVHQALYLYQQGRLSEAATLANEVIAARPDMGIAYYHLAQTQLEQGKVAEAVATMQRAVELEVASEGLIRQLALSLSQMGRYPDAVAVLQPLAGTGDPDALNAMGVVLSEGGRQQEARRSLERVFERDPKNPTAHENLALVALRLQDWAEARRQAEAAVALNEELGLSWNYLGAALYNQGKPHEALAAWQKSLAWEPDNYDVYFNIATVAAEVGDPRTVREALERFVAGAPPEQYGADIERARAQLRRMGG